jgi:hemerythrin superfamily protein
LREPTATGAVGFPEPFDERPTTQLKGRDIMARKAAAKRKTTTRALRSSRAANNGRAQRTTRSSRNGDSGSLLQMLKSEHQEVKDMLEQLVDNEDAEMRNEIFSKLKPNLEAHSHGEEEVFYPLLKQEEDTKSEAIEAYVEHNMVAKLLEELDGLEDKGDDEWSGRIKVLKDMVEHHIEEEEGQIFKDARKVLGAEKLKEIVDDYESVKQKYL